MTKSWAMLEDHVRSLAELRWNAKCVPEHLDGVNFDGVVRVSREEIVVLECTEENDLGKVRGDIARIAPTKMRLAVDGVVCRSYIVLRGEPTRSMREAGDAQKITVCSIEEFEKEIFDFSSYVHFRGTRPFGSAVDPETGASDTRKFIPVSYLDKEKGKELSTEVVADEIAAHKKVVLIGDYGTGKSRCVKEVFNQLKTKTQKAGGFPLAINLREHWGSRSAVEILTGHLSSIGMSTSFDYVIRLLNSGHLMLLLDGFDEVGAQTFDFRIESRTAIRRQALEGVRDLIGRCGGGVLVTGRSHFFDSDSELMECLGLSSSSTGVRIVHSPDNFSVQQGADYLGSIGIDIAPPEWLPRKPLIFQILAAIDRDEVKELLSKPYGRFSFWGTFVNAVCRREAAIHSSLSPAAVHAVLLELAFTTRSSQEFLGRLSPASISRAYEQALGAAPDDSGRQMLSRLCMLGRVEPESPDRQFVDENVIDILRAQRLIDDVAKMVTDTQCPSWKQSLLIPGVIYAADTVAAYDLEQLCLAFLEKFGGSNNRQQLAEIVSILTMSGSIAVDFKSLHVGHSHLPIFNSAAREISNIEIKSSYIDLLMLSDTKVSERSGVCLDECLFGIVEGVSGITGVPKWVRSPEVIEFEKVSNSSRIRDSHVEPVHKLFLSIVHKIFFQRGKGREESALLKGGFGQKFDHKAVDSILKILMREGLVERHRGDDGWIYGPNRRHTERMSRMMAELSLSDDPLWAEVGTIRT